VVGLSGESVLTSSEALAWLAATAFTTAVPGRVGVEIELMTRDATGAPLSDRALGSIDRRPLASGGRITGEPGGQLEVSTRVCSGLADAITSTAADLAELRRRCRHAGIALLGEGTEPLHLPPRRTDHPRYRAMEAYLDRYGPNGRRMMRATAAMQVTVESGTGRDIERRWRLVHAVAPALIATFANSPFIDGRDTGWASARQNIWSSLDSTRTRPVLGAQLTENPGEAFARYALAAPVMMMAESNPTESQSWSVHQQFTFAEWIDDHARLALRPATLADLQYHLTTLFPPVRPRGAVEIRYLDAQRGDGWVVPLAVVYSLVEDADAGSRALEAVEPTIGRWLEAARQGLANPNLAAASITLLDLATESLDRAGQPSWLIERVARFADDYPRRGRCPADDLRAVGPGVVPPPHPAIDDPIPVPIGVQQ
jgi:glutamate--cysteine ligase